MNKERLDYYMTLFDNLEKTKDGLDGGMNTEDYNFYCAIILEKIHQEYEKGDTLDRCY